jgi:carboxylesterase type B
MGAKEFLSEGAGLIRTSQGSIIHVAGNYRLGAYGFLNGVTAEKEGLPNTGFYDQRAVFEWVQKYIKLVGGNPDDVSAWGESAGGSSIMHHLAAENGKLDPLFRKFIAQSPAYSRLCLKR